MEPTPLTEQDKPAVAFRYLLVFTVMRDDCVLDFSREYVERPSRIGTLEDINELELNHARSVGVDEDAVVIFSIQPLPV